MPPESATRASLSLDPTGAAREGLGAMASGLIGSEILKIAGDVRALKRSGKPMCDLTVGDFSPKEFRIPKALEEAISRALAAGQTNYPPSDGILELRQAVQALYSRALGLEYPIEGVLIAGGARPVIWSVYRAVLDDGDRVVYPVPSWNNNHYAHLCGARGVPVAASAEDSFLPTADSLRDKVRSARLLALTSPLNPAGTGFGREKLAAIAELVVAENERRKKEGWKDRPLFLLYDHIYWMLAADDAPHFTPPALVPEVAPFTVFVDGISKSLASTGLRVGWAVGPPYVVSRLRDLLGHVGAWAPRPEQVATAELLSTPGRAEELARELRGGLLLRLNALYEGLSAMKKEGLPITALPPAGALYLSARFDLVAKLGSNEAIRKLLLEKAGFAVVPFQAFGLAEDTGWFRLSVGAVSVDEIRQAMPRVRAALRDVVGS
jgi:aspartate aminotransferase